MMPGRCYVVLARTRSGRIIRTEHATEFEASQAAHYAVYGRTMEHSARAMDDQRTRTLERQERSRIWNAAHPLREIPESHESLRHHTYISGTYDIGGERVVIREGKMRAASPDEINDKHYNGAGLAYFPRDGEWAWYDDCVGGVSEVRGKDAVERAEVLEGFRLPALEAAALA